MNTALSTCTRSLAGFTERLTQGISRYIVVKPWLMLHFQTVIDWSLAVTLAD